jgi:4-hydroxy-3-polyprenylbenzoate decarboxylase
VGLKIVVCITGASGAIYGVKLVEALKQTGNEVYLVVSEHAESIIEHETGVAIDTLRAHVHAHYSNSDLGADIASGSVTYEACVIVPCSMNTLAKISCGIADNLITRVASVCLKEKRKLILVPRETPLSKIHLEAMLKACDAGAIILPAMPGFYGKPERVDDLVNFIVGKVMDTLGIENAMYRRWNPAVKV